MEIRRATGMNRAAWNEIAEIREEAHQRSGTWASMSFWREGGVDLPPESLEALGGLEGARVLHLLCATGRDSLSLTNLGAMVTGVDISDAEIEIARRNAAKAGLDARFVASDVYALPAELRCGGFDVVYLAGGVLCWLPDLREWAEIVASALTRGGRLVLHEMHPVASCYHVLDGELRFVDDYFSRGEPLEVGAGWGSFDDGGAATAPKIEFQWPLGDVVTAVADAGLRIVALREHPPRHDDAWRWKEHLATAARMPGRFTLVAERDR